jgi:carboxypeptidase C (cathepsin A)
MSDTSSTSSAASDTPAAGGNTDQARRQREAVERLAALPPVVSDGAIVLDGVRHDYTVSATFIPVVADGLGSTGQSPDAAVFTTAYLKKGAVPSERPVCFAFNGGPGSASIWLHLGALGPKRVVIQDDGYAPAPPYAVVDNPESWFEHFDLVFIDPPHTGWSIAASDEARKKMLSVDGDVQCLTEVMRRWLTRHQRWGSPVLLCGESYGTTRGAALADAMQAAGVTLSGVILVSCAMDLQTIVFAPGNHLPYALFVPAFANTAQYHGLLKGSIAQSSQAAREAAEEFAAGEYLAALHAGARLSQNQRSRVARRLAELTGLPRALVEQHNLRISDQAFFFEAMRAQGRIIGRLESRVTGPMGATRSRDWEFDPGIDAIAGPYGMAGQAYFAGTLGLTMEQRYQTLNFEVNKGWNWNRGTAQGNGFASTTPDLARAMRRNPHLKVLVASGRYDLGTPYSATDWSLAQLDIPADVRTRLTHRYYDAGHMMYTREADLRQLKADLAAWLAS